MASRRAFLMLKRVVLLAGLLAGCAGLTRSDEVNLRGAQRLANAAVDAYGVAPVRVEMEPGGASRYQRGRIVLGQALLTNDSGSAALAHELAHHVLGHPEPAGPRPAQQMLDANAKSVEVMVRAWAVDPGVAFRLVAAHLRTLSAQPVLPGRLPPCEELADLYRRIPGRTEPREAYALGCTQIRGDQAGTATAAFTPRRARSPPAAAPAAPRSSRPPVPPRAA